MPRGRPATASKKNLATADQSSAPGAGSGVTKASTGISHKKKCQFDNM